MEQSELLDGERILSSYSQEKQDRLPGSPGDDREVMITSDGWISVYADHPLPGISKLHRLIRVNEISDIDQKRHDANPITSIINGLLHLFPLLLFIFMTAEPEFWGQERDIVICEDGSEVEWTGIEDCPEDTTTMESTAMVGFVFLAGPIFERILYFMWGRGVKDLFCFPLVVLTIKHTQGEFNLYDIRYYKHKGKLYWLPTIAYVASYSIFNGFQEFLIGVFILLSFSVTWYYFRTIRYGFGGNFAEETDQKKNIPSNTMDEFISTLELCLGISEEEPEIANIQTLGERLSEELEPIRRRLDEHHAILLDITPEYVEIYRERKPFLSISIIRSVISLMLESRLDVITPKRSRSVKQLGNLIDQTRKHDTGATSEILSDLETMRPIGNDAVHYLRAEEEDFISYLRRMARIVEWHVETPPVAITDR